jgi:hypothetical protein
MTFKIQLTEDQSEKVVAIMREKSQYRHILIESVEFTTDQTRYFGRTDFWFKTQSDCFRVKGIEEFLQMSQYGTTYIYPNDQIYSKLQLWFQPLLREYRLEEIGL